MGEMHRYTDDEKHKRYPADTRREALRPMRLGVGSREVARALGLPSDSKAGDPERLSNRRKAELGERLRRDYGFPSAGS